MDKTYTYDEVIGASLAYFDEDDLAASVFTDKYALKEVMSNSGEVTLHELIPDDMHQRLAVEFHRVESKYKNSMTYKAIYELFKNFKFVVPQGSPMAMIGNHYQIGSISNCVVLPKLHDSYGGIMYADQQIAQLSKRRCGVGMDISPIRPKGMPTKNSSITTDGIATFMERFSNTVREVGQSGRRGALILTLSVHHPEILTFVKIKNNLKKVTGANISVHLTDEFMKAVRDDKEYELRWPVDSKKPTIKTTMSANKVWHEIIKNAHATAEPGLMFIDTIKKWHPPSSYERYQVITSNPCCFYKHQDVFVVTDNGLKEIKDVKNTDMVWIDDENKWAKTSGYFDAGVADYYKVELNNGEQLFITENHKLAKIPQSRGSKGFNLTELKDIKVNDKIRVHMNEVADFNWGSSGTYDEGMLLGWLTGDGCLSFKSDSDEFPTTHLSFWKKEHDLADKFLPIVNNMGFRSSITSYELNRNEVLRISSSLLTRHLTEKYEMNMWKFKKGHNKYLSKFSKEFLKGYIASYFTADGCAVNNEAGNRYAIELGSIDKARLKQIRCILNLFGISSAVYKTRDAGTSTFRGTEYKTQTCYKLSISNKHSMVKFIKEIGFISNEKIKKSKELLKSLSKNRGDRSPSPYTRVKSIEYYGTGEVGCIEVDGYHRFSANGIISGNSEIVMNDDTCRLMAMNMLSFVEEPFTENAKFNYDSWHDKVIFAMRLMDDMVDLEIEYMGKIIEKVKADPEPDYIKSVEIKTWEDYMENARRGRRTGLGATGVGDTIAALGMKYGDDASIKFIDNVFKTKKIAEYISSAQLAAERGAFPDFDWELEKNNPFIKQIIKENPGLGEAMAKHGRRNVAISTMAPTGSLSILTQTSSGIEPVFQMAYKRRKKITDDNKDVVVDFVDQMGDKWQTFDVLHHGVKRWMDATGEKDMKKSPYFGATAEKIDWKQRVKLQATAQKHIDHSISSCLVEGDSMILTDNGLLDVSEFEYSLPKTFVNLDEKTYSYNINGKLAEITQSYNNGIADTISIKTECGYFINCTPNHRIGVLTDDYSIKWKHADTIKHGDIIVGRSGMNMWRKGSNHISVILNDTFNYKKQTNSKDVKIPKRITKKLARFMGYMCSDGSINKNGFSLCQLKNNVCYDFENLATELFNIEMRWQPDTRSENLFNIIGNSREVVAFLKWIGLKSHDIVDVPLLIRKSGRECVKEFIKGVTLDGHVSNNQLCVATSISYKFLMQLQQLLLNFGINTNLLKASDVGERVFPNCDQPYKTKDSWSLIVVGKESTKFVDMIGFAEERKIAISETSFHRPMRKHIYGETPDYGLRDRFKHNVLPGIKSQKLYNMFHSLTCADKRGRNIKRDNLLAMADVGFAVPKILTDETYVFRKVTSVKDYGMKQTFDLTVPEGNSYIANGMISHNTINLPSSATISDVKEIYETAWGSGCFKKGNFIYTTDGIKDISEIKIGDNVITHTGKSSIVDKVFKLPAEKRRFVKIKAAGIGSIESTEEHPFLVVEMFDDDCKKSWDERKKNRKWKMAKDIIDGDHIMMPLLDKYLIPIDHVNISDYTDNPIVINDSIFPSRNLPWKKSVTVKCANSIGIPNQIKIDEDFVEFVGWFIAEGHYSGRSLLRINLNVNEQHVAENLVRIVNDKFGLNPEVFIMETGNGRSLRIEFSSSILSQFLERNVGRGSYNKHLPEWFTQIHTDLLRLMVESHFDGDAGVTMSKTLAYQLAYARNIIRDRVYFKDNYGQGYTVSKTVCANKRIAKPLDKYLCYRVFNTEENYDDCCVYNFSVDGDNSYIVNGVAVHNCKGITVYRDGSRDGVLISQSNGNGNRPNKIIPHEAPKRPEALVCDIHTMSVRAKGQSETWICFVSMLEGRPYEVFTGLEEEIIPPKKQVRGCIVKRVTAKARSTKYDLYFNKDQETEIVFKDITSHFKNDYYGAQARLISLGLRHGVPMHHIVEQMQKMDNDDLYSFNKVIARVLKGYITDGTKTLKRCDQCGDEMTYQEGCMRCPSCGHSPKCN